MIVRFILIAALTVAPLSLLAEEAKEKSPWAGKASLGYLATSGNTENSTLNTGFEIGYASGQWAHLLTAAAITASVFSLVDRAANGIGIFVEPMVLKSSADFREEFGLNRFPCAANTLG